MKNKKYIKNVEYREIDKKEEVFAIYYRSNRTLYINKSFDAQTKLIVMKPIL